MSHPRNSLRIRRMHIRGRGGNFRGRGANFRGRGFSMIELLVVILIIAALIAILVPTLGGSRTAARRAKCLANLNGIGQAAGLYLEDNRRVYPGGTFGPLPAPTDVEVTWFNLLGKKGSDNTDGGDTDHEDRILTKYIPKADAAHCPLDKGTGDDSFFNLRGTSYIYYDRPTADITAGNKVGEDHVWSIEAHRATEVTKPAKKLFTADAIVRAGSYPDTDKNNQWHSPIIPLEVNIAFADGHAANAKRKSDTSGNPTSLVDIEDWSNDAEGYY